MLVPFTRQLGYALVVIVGIGLTSTGCRSTRSSLSSLPGMGWLGPQEADFSELSSEEGKSQLPPPSEAATPEVVTSGSQSKRSLAATPASPITKYPDTGYPTTLPGETRSAADSGGYAAGRSAPALDGQGSPSSTSSVSRSGETQHGFYGDQYPASGADSTGGGYDRDSTVDLTPPASSSYSGAGSSGRSYSGSDDRGNSGAAAASTPATSSATSAYDRTESSDSDYYGTQAGSSGADPLTQGAQEFVQGSEQQLRQGVDAVRQGVSNEYQQFTRGVSNQVENARQDAIGRAGEFQADMDRTVQQGVQHALQGAGVLPAAESTTAAEPRTELQWSVKRLLLPRHRRRLGVRAAPV